MNQVPYSHAHAHAHILMLMLIFSCFRKFYGKFKQGKMSNMKKSYCFHSVIVPANHIVTIIIECFINEGCTTRKPVILFCVVYT